LRFWDYTDIKCGRLSDILADLAVPVIRVNECKVPAKALKDVSIQHSPVLEPKPYIKPQPQEPEG
jgi:hypothetical protein